MRSTQYFRATSVLQLLFAATHTLGLLKEEDRGAAVEGAIRILKKNPFSLMGTPRTLWDLYLGFGLLFALFMLFAGAVSWQVGEAAKRDPVGPGWLGVAWTLFAAQLGVTALCWTHLFIAPQLISTVATVLLGLGARRIRRAAPKAALAS